jgi:hypothetical protein
MPLIESHVQPISAEASGELSYPILMQLVIPRIGDENLGRAVRPESVVNCVLFLPKLSENHDLTHDCEQQSITFRQTRWQRQAVVSSGENGPYWRLRFG